MPETVVDPRVAAAVAPHVEGDDEVVAGARAWVARRQGRIPLLLVGRTRGAVALTRRGRLLVAVGQRRVRTPLVVAADGLALRSVRTWTPLLQVRVTTGPASELVAEFPPRRRAAGRAFVDALRSTARPSTPG